MVRSIAKPWSLGVRTAQGEFSAWYALFVLFSATVLGSVDRQLIVLLGEPVRLALGLSDTKLGMVEGIGITLFSGLAAFPVGWAADRYGRRRLLLLSILVWSAATAACGLARDFSELMLAAIALGIGEAGLKPIVFGLIPEVFPERRRVLANSIYSLAAVFGTALGVSAGGGLIHAIDGLRPSLPDLLIGAETWRLSFFFMAVPGAIVAILLATLPGSSINSSSQEPATDRSETLHYLRTHRGAFFGFFGGLGMITLGFSALTGWLPIIAVRLYGTTPAVAADRMGLAYLVGTATGALLGALAIRNLRARYGPAMPYRVILYGLAGVAVCSMLMPVLVNQAALFGLFGIQVASMTATSVLLPTAMQDMCPAHMRSRIVGMGALFSFTFASLSPVIVGALSDFLSPHRLALLFATAFVSGCGAFLSGLILARSERAYVNTVVHFYPHLNTVASK